MCLLYFTLLNKKHELVFYIWKFSSNIYFFISKTINAMDWPVGLVISFYTGFATDSYGVPLCIPRPVHCKPALMKK